MRSSTRHWNSLARLHPHVKRPSSTGTQSLFTTLGLLAVATGTASAQSTLSQTSGLTSDVYSGFSVGGGYDIDGDGAPDYVTGAVADLSVAPAIGYVLAVKGSNGSVIHNLTDGVSGSRFGWSVDLVGDLNADGRSEIVVGAPEDGTLSTGRVYLYNGQTGAAMTLLASPTGSTTSDHFGWSVAGVGDVNADGVPDIAVGAPDAPPSSSGQVRVYSGSNGAVLYTFTGFSSSDAGAAVAGAGDVNSDGHADIVVGMPALPVGGTPDVGNVRLYSGIDGSVIRDHTGGLTVGLSGDTYGYAVDGVGDADGDGVDDYVIGVPSDDDGLNQFLGSVELRSGSTGALIHKVYGENAGDNFGTAVAGVGDVDKDGFADFAGSSIATPNYTKVYSGETGQLIVRLAGGPGDTSLGFALDGAGDVNGDGFKDLVLGDPGVSPGATKVISPVSTTDSLVGLPAEISVALGDVHGLALKAPSFAGRFYVIVGSISGTTPGFDYPSSSGGLTHVPLNADTYYSITQSNPPFISNWFGTLDAQGKAVAWITVPPGTTMAPGTTFNHAFLVINPVWPPTFDFASNPVAFKLVP